MRLTHAIFNVSKVKEAKIMEKVKQNNLNSDSLFTVRSIFKIIENLFFAVLLIVFGIIGALLLQGHLSPENRILDNYKTFVVLSGSMNPTFDAKSLIVVKPIEASNVRVGDILTFRSSDTSNNNTTHRVVEINNEMGNLSFITRGDANNVNDPVPLYPQNIIGKVSFSIPFIGFLINYASTRNGMFALVIFPASALIAYELIKILMELAKVGDDENKIPVITWDQIRRDQDFAKSKYTLIAPIPQEIDDSELHPIFYRKLQNRKFEESVNEENEKKTANQREFSFKRKFEI